MISALEHTTHKRTYISFSNVYDLLLISSMFLYTNNNTNSLEHLQFNVLPYGILVQ